MERVLRDAPWALALDLVDADGATVSDATAVSAAITKSDGTPLDGSPFTVTPLDAPVLELSAANTAALDVYDVDWTISRPGGDEHRRSQFEVVGAFLYTPAELRARYQELADENIIDGATIRKNRDAVEDLIEHWTSPSFRQRARRLHLTGSDAAIRGAVLELPDTFPTRLISIAIDGVPLTDDQLGEVRVHEMGILERLSITWWASSPRTTVEVFYEHGMRDVPRDAVDNAMKLARATLVPEGTPARATAIDTSSGSYRLTIAGRDGPTGLPDVDAFLDRWGAQNDLYVA
jgi:hypothetical protein